MQIVRLRQIGRHIGRAVHDAQLASVLQRLVPSKLGNIVEGHAGYAADQLLGLLVERGLLHLHPETVVGAHAGPVEAVDAALLLRHVHTVLVVHLVAIVHVRGRFVLHVVAGIFGRFWIQAGHAGRLLDVDLRLRLGEVHVLDLVEGLQQVPLVVQAQHVRNVTGTGFEQLAKIVGVVLRNWWPVMYDAATYWRQVVLVLILLLEGLEAVVHGYIRWRGAVAAGFRGDGRAHCSASIPRSFRCVNLRWGFLIYEFVLDHGLRIAPARDGGKINGFLILLLPSVPVICIVKQGIFRGGLNAGRFLLHHSLLHGVALD